MTKSFLVRMPDEIFDALKSVSELGGTSMNQLAVEGIQQVLSARPRPTVEEVVDKARVRYADVLDKLKQFDEGLGRLGGEWIPRR